MTIREMAVTIARLAGGVHDNLLAGTNKVKVLVDVEGIDTLAREIIGAVDDKLCESSESQQPRKELKNVRKNILSKLRPAGHTDGR